MNTEISYSISELKRKDFLANIAIVLTVAAMVCVGGGLLLLQKLSGTEIPMLCCLGETTFSPFILGGLAANKYIASKNLKEAIAHLQLNIQ